MGLFGLKLPKKEDILNPLKGVGHQLNIFDGGRTYDTNQRGVTPGTANPVSMKSDNTPGFQITNNSLTRGLSRGFDQINPLDSGRSWQSRMISPEMRNTSAAKQGYRQFLEPTIVTPVQHSANTVGALATSLLGLGWAGKESIFGTDESYQNALNATSDATDELLDYGWGGKGAFGSSAEMKSDSFNDSFIKPVTRGVAEVAPIVVPGAGGVVTKGMSLPARAGILGLENAAVSGTTDAAMQLANTGEYDIGQGAKATGAGFVLGVAPPVLGAGVRGGGRVIVDKAPPVAKNVKVAVKNRVPLGEEGFIKLPGGKKEVVTGAPKEFPDLADAVARGKLSGKTETVPIKGLKLGSDALGDIDQATITQYQQLIRNDGKIAPLVLTKDGFVADGKHRLIAMKREGITDVPVVRESTPKVVVRGAARQSMESKRPALATSEAGFVAPGQIASDIKAGVSKLFTREKPEVTPPPKGKVIVRPAKNGIATEIKRGISDADQVILDELRSIEKQTGQKGLVDKFMYLSNQQRGSNRGANIMLEKSKFVKKAIGNQGKKEAADFSTYANARSELASAIRQRTPTGRQKKVKTSLPMKELQAIVKEGDKVHKGRFQALNRHYKELTKMAHEAGIIDKKTFREYNKNNDYIRLQRDLGDKIPDARGGRGQGYQLGSTTLKQRRKGSKRDTLDAAEVMAERTQQVHREAAKNKSGAFLTKTLEQHGLAKKVPASKAANLNTVGVFENGKKVFYEVSPSMKEAMDNISPYQMNVVMKILAAPGRVFRAGVTGLNPVFIARNLVKDQFGSAINSKQMLATHNPKTFFSGLAAASRDAVGGKNSQLYDEFLKHYGDQTSFDLTRNVKDTKKVIAEMRGGRKVKVINKLKSPIRTLEDIASVTEKSTRYQNFKGAYQKAIKDGMPKDAAMEHAAIQAWQNSVDFARAGTWGRVINTVLPYWNPSTQGVRQMGRTFKDRPISSVMKGTALVGIPLVTASAWNNQEGNKEIYDNIPDFEKENNIILIPPGTKQNDDGTYDVFKIPLPPGIKDVFMPLRRAMDSYAGDKPAEFGAMAQDLIQTVAGPVQTGSLGQFAGSFIPQIAKPSVQAAANKDFFTGRDIVPEFMNEATDADGNPVADKDKAYKTTSGTARQLGGMFNMSPIAVEKFIKDSSGTVGLNLLNLADNLQAASGTIPQEQIGGQSVATGFKRSFASVQGEENFNKSEGAKYFDTLKRLSDEIKLTKSEKDAWGALHPAKKNFLGEQVYERDATYDPAARLDIYNRFPKVFELDKRLDSENRKAGKPGNPLFDQEPWQVKKILEKENLPPGAKDPELTNLYQQEWYQNYRLSKTDFFNKLKADAEKEGRTFGSNDNPYPETPPEVQKAMDIYNSLPKGTGARSAWIRSNPGAWLKMQQSFAATDNWQNIARGKRGLDMTEGEIGRMAGYGDNFSSGGSGGGSGGGSKNLNPASFVKKYGIGGQVKSGQAKSSGKVSVKARTSGGSGGKIKVTSKKLRLA